MVVWATVNVKRAKDTKRCADCPVPTACPPGTGIISGRLQHVVSGFTGLLPDPVRYLGCRIGGISAPKSVYYIARICSHGCWLDFCILSTGWNLSTPSSESERHVGRRIPDGLSHNWAGQVLTVRRGYFHARYSWKRLLYFKLLIFCGYLMEFLPRALSALDCHRLTPNHKILSSCLITCKYTLELNVHMA